MPKKVVKLFQALRSVGVGARNSKNRTGKGHELNNLGGNGLENRPGEQLQQGPRHGTGAGLWKLKLVPPGAVERKMLFLHQGLEELGVHGVVLSHHLVGIFTNNIGWVDALL